MKCRTCKRGPDDGVTIYLENKPSEMPAVWACAEHRTATDDPVVERIVRLLENNCEPLPEHLAEPEEE